MVASPRIVSYYNYTIVDRIMSTKEVMNTSEEEATRYELIKAKEAYIKQLEQLEIGKYNTKQVDFLSQYLVNLRKEITDKSTFTLEQAIEELGFCYDVGTRIRHIIARHISDEKQKGSTR